MRIGSHELVHPVLLAPMAGVTDRPAREYYRAFGAGYMVGEMLSSQQQLHTSRKSQLRLDCKNEPAPSVIQLLGVDPADMAHSARWAIDNGAQIIDINMGCPAKKVCHQSAGSALMRDEPLALAIIEAVVVACAPRNVAVTLKMRTGWNEATKNALSLARAAQSAGVQMIAIHGRTREQFFHDRAEYDTIAQVKAALEIPIIANGDIDCPQKALAVLQYTGADGVMIGRASLGRPWLLREMAHFLATGATLPPPTITEVARQSLAHLEHHHSFYGSAAGVRSARKHVTALLRPLPGSARFIAHFNTLSQPSEQLRQLAQFFEDLSTSFEHLPTPTPKHQPQHDVQEP